MSKYRQTRERLQSWIEKDTMEATTGSSSSLEQMDCSFHISPLATVPELETTHSPAYIQRYLAGNMTDAELRNVGFPWSPQNVQRSLSSVGGTVAAACAALEKRKGDNSELHWAAHVAGGTHHAFWDRGEGFSVFSDMAVAANVVRQRYGVQRILLLDLHVHQGNGNAVLFQNNPQVATVSIHCAANYFSRKEASDLDIELPAGCNDQTYLMTLQHWLNRLRKEQQQQSAFDLVFFQAGVDVLEHDRLGRMSLSLHGVQRRNQMVYEYCRDIGAPLVVCMGGGYPKGDDWEPILQAHASVYYQAYTFVKTNGRKDS